MTFQNYKKLLAITAVLLGLAGGLTLAAWYRENNTPFVSTDFLMDTFIEQKLYGKNAEDAVNEISTKLQEFENTFSMHQENSDISRLNAAAGGDAINLSEDVYRLLERGKKLSLLSEGAFDLTVAPLTQIWQITADNPRIPSTNEITMALEMVDANDLILEEGAAKLNYKGQAIDLGGIAKGAACDIVREVAEKYDIDCGYVSIGGNLVVLQQKPLGRDFYFGVRDPAGTASDAVCAITLYGKTMATTGAYERYFEKDGKIYHHVIDPQTGWPAESDLLSVSVISEDGTLADYLSTTLFVLGKDTVLNCLGRSDFQVIAVGKDGNIYCSADLKQNIVLTENSTNYDFVYGERE